MKPSPRPISRMNRWLFDLGWIGAEWFLRRTFWGHFISRHPTNHPSWWTVIQARWPMVLKSKPIALPKGPIRLHVWHTRGVLDAFLLGQWCEQWGRSWRMWMHPKVYVELGAPSWAYSAPTNGRAWVDLYRWAEAEQAILVIFHASPPRPRRRTSTGSFVDLVGRLVVTEEDGTAIPPMREFQSIRWAARRPTGKKMYLDWEWEDESPNHQV